MSDSAESTAEVGRSLYEQVAESLAPNLLVQFNTSDPTTMTTEEMVVTQPWDDDMEKLSLKAGEDWVVLKDGPDGFGVYEEVDGHYLDLYTEVTTIEVVGVGS